MTLRTLPAIVFALLIFTAPTLAFAEGHPRPPQCQNHEVTLQLQTEEWVVTDTAQVIASIRAAADPAHGTESRTRALNLLRTLLPDTQTPDGIWRITLAQIERDPSGLERLTFTAEIRVIEHQLTGLYDKAKTLSKPGMALNVQAINWIPSLQQNEAAAARARNTLYRLASEETVRLNHALGTHYRVGDLHVGTFELPQPPAYAQEKMMVQSTRVARDIASIPRADRLTLPATVILRERECQSAIPR